MQRRGVLKTLSGLGAAALMTGTGVPAFARSEELTAVVPFPPGGGGDMLARTVLEPLAAKVGTPVVVLNRPGAGGNIGTATVVKAAADGRTAGYVTNGILCVNPHLYPKSFDPLEDLMPVVQISTIGLCAVINQQAVPGVTDMQSLIAYARANPGVLAYASSGAGTTSHMAGALFAKSLGLDLNHIPHPGGAAAIREVIAGRVPLMIEVMPNVMPHIQGGLVKALAVTTPKRSALLPEIPTMAELGVAGCELFAWDGLVFPKGIAAEKVRALNEEINAVLKDETVRKRLLTRGAEPAGGSPEAFAAFIKSEAPKWEALAKEVKPAQK